MVGESDAWHVGTNTIADNRDVTSPVTSRYGLFYSLRLFTEVYSGVQFIRFILVKSQINLYMAALGDARDGDARAGRRFGR